MYLGFAQDLRHAARSLWKSPGFVLPTLLSLALGIGINTSIFSVIHTALERPVSGRNPQELADVSLATPNGGMRFTYPEYLEIRRRSQSFSDVMGLTQTRYRTGGRSRPEFVTALAATPNFFAGFGQDAMVGRTFSRGEGGAREVVLGEAFWRRRFAGERAAIGKPLVLYEGTTPSTYTIVGVLPRSFRYSSMWGPDVVVPFPATAAVRNGGLRAMMVMARVKPGLSMARARAETGLLAKQLAPMFPDSFGTARLNFSPKVRRDAATRTVAAVLQAAFGLVLLIACANVMNLFLARHQARRFEVATRLALGASRGRLMRQLLTESLLLAIPSALAGYGVAVLTIHVVERIRIPALEGIQMYFYLDRTVFGFALCAGVAAAVVAGLWPARAASRLDLGPALKGGAAVGRRTFGVRGVLVAAQLALSMLGITAATMLTRSVWQMNPFDPGVDPHTVLTAAVWPSLNGYTADRSLRFRRELESRLRAQAGVQGVAFAAWVPGGGGGEMQKVSPSGSAAPPSQEVVSVGANRVAPGFLGQMGIQVLRGRDYSAADEGGRPRCVINETMARRFWPDREPLGQMVRLGGNGGAEHEVIGVVRDTVYDRNGDDPAPFLYLPLGANDSLTIFVRAGGPAESLSEPLRRAVAALDAEMPVQDLDVMAAKITGGPNGTELRLRAGLMGTLGGTALLLSALGLYGVLTYVVSRRTREIGIRLALGASRANVLAAVFKDGLRLVAAGMAAGVALSLVVCPLLTNHVFGVTPNHPAVILASCAMLGSVGLGAMWVPARRASRMEALAALRHE